MTIAVLMANTVMAAYRASGRQPPRFLAAAKEQWNSSFNTLASLNSGDILRK
jgi:hypothetical protein